MRTGSRNLQGNRDEKRKTTPRQPKSQPLAENESGRVLVQGAWSVKGCCGDAMDKEK
jgi:hypothetical protein